MTRLMPKNSGTEASNGNERVPNERAEDGTLTELPTKLARVGIAADHGGYELKEYLAAKLREAGHEVVDFGAARAKADDDYPDFVVPLARAVATGALHRGIAICGSGVGASVCANKVAGIRACLIHENFSAHQGVEDDDLNLICFGGLVVGHALAWELTQTFLAARFIGAARFRRRLGKVAELEEVGVAGSGTPGAVLQRTLPDSFENDPGLWIAALPRPTDASNKFTRGHALVSGGYPTTGASRMAARAAARAGAGLTTIAVPNLALPIYATALTSIMVKGLTEPEEFARLLDDRRITAVLIGPGAGTDEDTRARVLAILKSRRPAVVDAGALTAFKDEGRVLERAIEGPCVLTPHEGEFRRVFGDLSGDKLTRARAAAQRSGAVIVLKGSDTVIAAPSGLAVINANAPPTLATAGSGDVLSGIILGLLAQGMDPFLAACAAVWLHGAAASDFGPGLIAEDLPELLPGVLRRIHAHADVCAQR